MGRCLFVFFVSLYTLVTSGKAQDPDTLRSTDEFPFSFFGSSVALSGDRALVGGYIFEPSEDGSWKQEAEIEHSMFAEALDGEFALIGHFAQNEVAVFEHQPGGAWPRVATIHADDAVEGDNFGISVAIDGDRALVGAAGTGESAGGGAAYIFERESDGSWTQVAKVTPLDPSEDSGRFGWRVALDGDRALVAWGNRDLPDQPGWLASGVVHLFQRQPDGSWPLASKLVIPGVSEESQLGESVSVEGDIAVVKAFPARFGASSRAYVFEHQADGSWQHRQELTGTALGALSVAVEGDYALVGGVNAESRGVAVLYERQSNRSWTQRSVLSVDAASIRFGYAVDLDDGAALVGEWRGFGPGSAYLFDNVVPTTRERSTIVPSSALDQNFPNPFNSTTTISYSLFRPSDVTLSVFDLLGRETRVLASGTKSAGRYEVTFDATNVTAGIYFYRLTTGDFTVTKTLVILR